MLSIIPVYIYIDYTSHMYRFPPHNQVKLLPDYKLWWLINFLWLHLIFVIFSLPFKPLGGFSYQAFERAIWSNFIMRNQNIVTNFSIVFIDMTVFMVAPFKHGGFFFAQWNLSYMRQHN